MASILLSGTMGLNLLPTDFSDDLVLLTFCAKEKSFAM